jgi:ribosomal protein S18 acetylase RimI-like enzyme
VSRAKAQQGRGAAYRRAVSTGADERLLDAVAESHRRWFRERGEASCLVGPDPDVEALVRTARSQAAGTAGGFGVWSLGRDDRLGVRLVARGFEWGWQPHWMGIDLEREPAPPERFEVGPAEPPFAKTLPYREEGRLPPEAIHLGVRARGHVVGQVIVLPDEGVAGIYSMGVAPKARRRGIGLALTRAALRAAWEHDCQAVVLNATADGEALYARAGFRSVGWGQTWWFQGGEAPTTRRIELMEAVGFGDVAALAALAPSEAEAGGIELPGGADSIERGEAAGSDQPEGRLGTRRPGTPPLALAALTGQAESVDYLLTRFPALAATRFPPHGGNLLHLAVEHDRPEVVEAALRHGVDREARDEQYNATPAGWAEVFDRAYLR